MYKIRNCKHAKKTSSASILQPLIEKEHIFALKLLTLSEASSREFTVTNTEYMKTTMRIWHDLLFYHLQYICLKCSMSNSPRQFVPVVLAQFTDQPESLVKCRVTTKDSCFGWQEQLDHEATKSLHVSCLYQHPRIFRLRRLQYKQTRLTIWFITSF